ncbi:4Fe-4S dicluster domain-containing protein [Diplocloster hominis]|uniref:4Fe-4S dicluster domain-containing protein n=1 Tax=Diplocloster hominis TaxID=3079010 RepID=UPI003CCF24CE
MANLFGLFSNRETNTGVENGSSKKITVDTYRCPQNHACPSIKVCPVGALSQKGFHAPVVDMDQCIKCGKCVKFCPMRAISLR